MKKNLENLLAELEQFGKDNDASVSERPRRMLNITHDTGEFLAVMVYATNAHRILEIGTSNGYSTLWLASAVHNIGGLVTTVERSDYKVGMAAKNFSQSGLDSYIKQVQDDAGHVLSQQDDSTYDMIFLDSERTQYPQFWPNIKRVLRPGGLLVVDNATSHAEEIKPLIDLAKADADFVTCLVPIGNGEFLAMQVGQL